MVILSQKDAFLLFMVELSIKAMDEADEADILDAIENLKSAGFDVSNLKKVEEGAP